jgi:hypothetical protein
MIVNRLYTLATVLIIAGLVMLCQPFSMFIHVCAFPVLIVGVILFLVLDHLPNFDGDGRRNPKRHSVRT